MILRFLSQIETRYRMNFWRNLFQKSLTAHHGLETQKNKKNKKQIFREGHRGRETNGQMQWAVR